MILRESRFPRWIEIKDNTSDAFKPETVYQPGSIYHMSLIFDAALRELESNYGATIAEYFEEGKCKVVLIVGRNRSIIGGLRDNILDAQYDLLLKVMNYQNHTT